MLFLPLCLCEDLDVEELAAGALAEDPVVELGVSAAIAAAAMPKDNRAEAINLIMGSPAVVLSSETKNTPDQPL